MSSLFGGKTGAASSPQDMEQRKQQVMNEVRQQLALANAQELINKMNEKCFAKCITKPSTSLSSSDEGCLSRCTDRFLEAFNIISKTYVARVSKEREGALLEGGAQGQFGAGGGLI